MLLVGGGALGIPAPLPLEVLLEILPSTGLTGLRSWIAFFYLIRHAVLACRDRYVATLGSARQNKKRGLHSPYSPILDHFMRAYATIPGRGGASKPLHEGVMYG